MSRYVRDYDLMPIKRNDVVWYENRFTGEIEKAIVLHCHPTYFVLWINKRHFNVSYDYAKGKVFRLIEKPQRKREEYPPLPKPHKPKPPKNTAFVSGSKSKPKPAPNIPVPVGSPYAEVEAVVDISPSCDNCMLMRRGDCTELRPSLCSSYKPVPYVSSAERKQWEDSKEVFYRYEEKYRRK